MNIYMDLSQLRVASGISHYWFRSGDSQVFPWLQQELLYLQNESVVAPSHLTRSLKHGPLNITILQFISPFLAKLPSGLPQKHNFRPPFLVLFPPQKTPASWVSENRSFGSPRLCPFQARLSATQSVCLPLRQMGITFCQTSFDFSVPASSYVNVLSILHPKNHAFHSLISHLSYFISCRCSTLCFLNHP